MTQFLYGIFSSGEDNNKPSINERISRRDQARNNLTTSTVTRVRTPSVQAVQSR